MLREENQYLRRPPNATNIEMRDNSIGGMERGTVATDSAMRKLVTMQFAMTPVTVPVRETRRETGVAGEKLRDAVCPARQAKRRFSRLSGDLDEGREGKRARDGPLYQTDSFDIPVVGGAAGTGRSSEAEEHYARDSVPSATVPASMVEMETADGHNPWTSGRDLFFQGEGRIVTLVGFYARIEMGGNQVRGATASGKKNERGDRASVDTKWTSDGYRQVEADGVWEPWIMGQRLANVILKACGPEASWRRGAGSLSSGRWPTCNRLSYLFLAGTLLAAVVEETLGELTKKERAAESQLFAVAPACPWEPPPTVRKVPAGQVAPFGSYMHNLDSKWRKPPSEKEGRGAPAGSTTHCQTLRLFEKEVIFAFTRQRLQPRILEEAEALQDPGADHESDDEREESDWEISVEGFWVHVGRSLGESKRDVDGRARGGW
ncbi:hypothetical protein BDK51DRAFT_44609 [Blyttiomyces helicus]|uniref:Uncharacterized protein n=1 Tax=Blyttiomyces helicus TaxID=388810 RepID=A0A4P9WC53_9FUNG|nr:hypothetical protein BDK51DRAFT_44609 [Blyttiomyces helicus]|eukprot:RKO90231.1 hypothetical protein BDK51DRAFT_44609 [Blyttiomyces helicus]